MCKLTVDSKDLTVGALFAKIVEASPKLKKQNFDLNRMRLTVGDAKGRAMADKRQNVNGFFTEDEKKAEITLVFKDLGAQISWKLVFLIEYFGPILITVLLVLF
jgi:very-long-chain enoyl-CoA reductase